MRILTIAAATAISLGTVVQANAKEIVEFWHFFNGSDGKRMGEFVDAFNKAHEGSIEVVPTMLEWGQPFYTKIQTSVAVGESPDLISYTTSGLRSGVFNGVLEEILPSRLANIGFSKDDFPDRFWNAVHLDGKLYAIPFDSHPLVLYYNKQKLSEAGLLGENGLPKDLDTVEGFSAVLKKLKDAGNKWSVSMQTNAGPPARLGYSLLGQLDGEMLTNGEWLAGDNGEKVARVMQVMSDWVKDGYMPPYTEYVAALALFSSGEVPLHINGVWEVPGFNSLKAEGKLFDWGAVELPRLFDHRATFVDSHVLAIPRGRDATKTTPEREAAVDEVIRWLLKNGMVWASAGHIPSLKSVTSSEEYQSLQPNATYSVALDNAVYTADSPHSGIGFGGAYLAASGAFSAALNGELSPEEAVDQLKEELDQLR